MRRAHVLILVAWLLHGISWFLPVITSVKGGDISPGIPGYTAFSIAASCALRSCEDSVFDSRHGAVLAAASVVTTLLFVFGSPIAIWRRSRSYLLVSGWIAAIAFVVNGHWCVLPKGDSLWSDLGIGYFVWWSSFAVIAAGFFDLARITLGKSIRSQQTAATL